MTTQPSPLVAANFPPWLELGPWVSQDGTLDIGDLPLLKANGLRWQPHDFPRHSVAVSSDPWGALWAQEQDHVAEALWGIINASELPRCKSWPASCRDAGPGRSCRPHGHSSGSHPPAAFINRLPLPDGPLEWRWPWECTIGLSGAWCSRRGSPPSLPSGLAGQPARWTQRPRCGHGVHADALWPSPGSREELSTPHGSEQGGKAKGRCILLFYLGSQQPSLMPRLRSGSGERGPARVGQRTHGGVARGSCPTNSWRCISAVHPVHHRAVAGQGQRHLPTSWSPSSALRPLNWPQPVPPNSSQPYASSS